MYDGCLSDSSMPFDEVYLLIAFIQTDANNN
jgi:hypothetical protein